METTEIHGNNRDPRHWRWYIQNYSLLPNPVAWVSIEHVNYKINISQKCSMYCNGCNVFICFNSDKNERNKNVLYFVFNSFRTYNMFNVLNFVQCFILTYVYTG